MHQGIHQQFCQGQHEHQQIAGQTNINGTRQNISTYAGKYTNRFARTVAKLILHGNNVGEDPLIVEELLAGFEGVPGRKRQSSHRETVMDSLQLKRRRCAFKQSTPIAFQRTDVGATWERVFADLGKVTPRVGTMSIERGELFEEIQKLSHPIQVKLIVTCRGTERFRVPKRTIPKEDMPWRRTLYVNRADGTIVDAGLERWTVLTKAQQVRKAGPARLSLTIFGQKREPSQSSNPRAGNEAISELPGLTLGRSPEKDLGWAPPPIALSGPQFRDLAADEREGIRRLHNNLGHPDPQMFAKFLKERGSEGRIVEGALQYQCSTCAESKPAPVAARPSSIHKDLDFNDVVGADGAHWQGQSGETFHFMHFLDESTLFHVGAVSGRTVQEQIRTFEDTWLLWAGPCKTLYLDPAGEYVNDTWATYLQSEGIKVEMSAGESPWQLGRCERHGKIVKDMLTRMDKEQKIEGEQEFKRCLRQVFAAKNALSRIHGFTPEQALLGKARAVPASIVSDSEVASHSLAESDTPEGIRFRQDLLRREQARRSFISADNDSSFRRALLRRSRPSRLHYEMGDWVLYWRKQKGNDRNERGRWHGPAQVITNEKDKVIWMSHCGRLIRASPEQIRPASLREFQCLPRDEEGRVRDERLIQGQGPRSFEVLEGVPDVSGDVEMDARTDSYEPSETLGQIQNQVSERSQPEQEASPPCSEASPNLSDYEPSPMDGISVPVPSEAEEDDLLFGDELPCDAADHYEIDIRGFPGDEIWENSFGDEECFIVSSARKQRVEVKWEELSEADKEKFRAAKQKEVNAWMDHKTVKRVAGGTLDPSQIMKCRWILVWKPPEKEGGERRAKARLVILGFQDPGISYVPNDAPTLSKDGKSLLLQMVSSQRWTLLNFDISTAFLKGEGDGRKLGIHPTTEISEALKLKGSDQCQLVGGAYGRIDAPFLWYQAFRTTLEDNGFVVCPFDSCLFSLVTEGEDGKPVVHGILGIHVDDGLGGGDGVFMAALERVRRKYSFGAYNEREFCFLWCEIFSMGRWNHRD